MLCGTKLGTLLCNKLWGNDACFDTKNFLKSNCLLNLFIKKVNLFSSKDFNFFVSFFRALHVITLKKIGVLQ